jgi:RimJ/RimL family protein N-acetyltransferase
MRPITLDDIEHLYQLNLDPDVIKYTGDPPFESIEETRAFYSNYDQYEMYKTGRFSTFLKHGDIFIGWCGLKYHEDGEVDLGYRFLKKFWGQGYATESSKASLDYGFNNLKFERIYAEAMKENPASIRVMQKVGMKYVRDVMIENHSGVRYEIS